MPHGLIRFGSVTAAMPLTLETRLVWLKAPVAYKVPFGSLIVTVGAERAGRGVGVGAGDVEDVGGVLGDGPGGRTCRRPR